MILFTLTWARDSLILLCGRRVLPRQIAIILLTDDVRPLDFDITQIPIRDYCQSAVAFEKAYVHSSVNPELFERTCFTRWFVMREFVRRHVIGRFCVFDTDVMLFSSVEGFAAEFGSHAAGNWTWANAFSDVAALDLLCDYFSGVFADSALFDQLAEKIYRDIGRRQISDMRLVTSCRIKTRASSIRADFPPKATTTVSGSLKTSFIL